jgi:RNA polymerase sigma-54 factor
MSAMRPGLSQGLRLRQELKVNPRLYQAMDLLYMPLLDLQQHLKQELVNNPFLDLEEPAEDEEELKDEREEQEDTEDDEVDWEEILLNGFDAGGRRAEYEEKEYFRPTPVATRDLWDHLAEQLKLLTLDTRAVLIGLLARPGRGIGQQLSGERGE